MLTKSGILSSQRTVVSKAAWRRHFDWLSVAANGTTIRLSSPLRERKQEETQITSIPTCTDSESHSPHSVHGNHASCVGDAELVLTPAAKVIDNYSHNYQMDGKRLLLIKHQNRTCRWNRQYQPTQRSPANTKVTRQQKGHQPTQRSLANRKVIGTCCRVRFCLCTCVGIVPPTRHAS